MERPHAASGHGCERRGKRQGLGQRGDGQKQQLRRLETVVARVASIRNTHLVYAEPRANDERGHHPAVDPVQPPADRSGVSLSAAASSGSVGYAGSRTADARCPTAAAARGRPAQRQALRGPPAPRRRIAHRGWRDRPAPGPPSAAWMAPGGRRAGRSSWETRRPGPRASGQRQPSVPQQPPAHRGFARRTLHWQIGVAAPGGRRRSRRRRHSRARWRGTPPVRVVRGRRGPGSCQGGACSQWCPGEWWPRRPHQWWRCGTCVQRELAWQRRPRLVEVVQVVDVTANRPRT